jgi:hypothetical protein
MFSRFFNFSLEDKDAPYKLLITRAVFVVLVLIVLILIFG